MDTLLKETQEAFTQWRANRKRQGKVNNALKKRVLNLLNHYPLLTLSDAIGVKPMTISNWKHEAKLNKKERVDFISLPIIEASTTVQGSSFNGTNKSAELIITIPGNLQLILPEQSLAKTIQFIHALSKEFSS